MAGLNVFLIIYFMLVTVTSGLSISAGLFVPMLIIGATFGRIIGRIVAFAFSGLSPPIDTSIYALVGSAAMMSGFSRTTISLCVILVELTESKLFVLIVNLCRYSVPPPNYACRSCRQVGCRCFWQIHL